MAKSRRKTLEKMERIDKPMIDARSANIQFGFDRNTGNDVMHIHDLKVVTTSPITLPINLEIFKGDHIAIIGPNGVGKTTLIKTIAEKQHKLGGQIIFGANFYKLVTMIKNKLNLNQIKPFSIMFGINIYYMNEKDVRQY